MPYASKLRILRPPIEPTQEDNVARNETWAQSSFQAQNLPQEEDFARNTCAQESALRPPVEMTQGTQDNAIRYRLTDEQVRMFCALYPDVIPNKDDCLKKVGANSAYRAHANEIIEQYRLLEKKRG